MCHDASTSDDTGSALSRVEFVQSEVTVATLRNVRMKFRLLDSLVGFSLDSQGVAFEC